MSAGPPTWRPARSTGVPLGVAISLVALACTLVLVAIAVGTSSEPTRVVCLVGAVIGLPILLVVLVGTWWCSTLRYALDPAAVEIRFGSRISRLPYTEIEGVAARSDEPAATPTLWPGAHFGWSHGSSGEVEAWRATTRNPRNALVVLAGGIGSVLTPREPATIRATLIANARQTDYAGPTGAGPGRTWLDAVARVDGWVRALVFGAAVVASMGIGADGVRFGALQPDGFSAAAVLLANATAALVVSGRWPVFARFLAAGALTGQVIALF